jgi:protein tyrosine/serine phosphatase
MFDQVVDPSQRVALEERPPPGQAYIQMLGGAGPAVAGAIAALADAAGRPAVIHCTAGKDRTGILAGLILSVLGVADADVVADYELTNETREQRDAYLEVHDPQYLAMLRSLPSWVREADGRAMQATLDHVRSEFGSARGYMDAAGVDATALATLRAALLEP